MTTSITSSITEGQEKQYRRLIADLTNGVADTALGQVPMDKDGMQMLLGRGDELKASVIATIIAKTRELSHSNQFADEEVKSDYAYPQGYRTKPILQQVAILKGFFPNLETNDEVIWDLADRPLPAGADGWFAIPRWEKIAATYNGAFLTVLSHIASKRKFYNYREGELDEQHLRQTERAIAAWKKLGEEQGGDILVVAAQFGIRHRGCSVRRARKVMVAGEFGLGAFAVGCMLLTHPEKEVNWEQLHIDCAGDEFSPRADGRFVKAPVFHFKDDELKFYARDVVNASERSGSASGFLPQ